MQEQLKFFIYIQNIYIYRKPLSSHARPVHEVNDFSFFPLMQRHILCAHASWRHTPWCTSCYLCTPIHYPVYSIYLCQDFPYQIDTCISSFTHHMKCPAWWEVQMSIVIELPAALYLHPPQEEYMPCMVAVCMQS